MNDDFSLSIVKTKAEWEKISHALADVLCWHAGFNAGKQDSDASDPCDLPTLRKLNLSIKDML